MNEVINKETNKQQIPWLLVRNRTIPIHRPVRVGEVNANFCGKVGVACSAQQVHTAVNLGFLDRSRNLFIHVAPELSSRL
jgi:hypothetical protein